MTQTLYEYCSDQKDEALLKSWNQEKNGDLTPKRISYGSRQIVWWTCERGHSWEAAVYSRVSGCGCPYCAGKRPWPGENDLATKYPDLAKEWHPEKNRDLTPDLVTIGSHHKAWWRCEKGHEWQAIVKSRTSGTGCPYCTNRMVSPGENDLATTHPNLALEWHNEKNAPLTPQDLMAGSHKKVWWHCEKGHEWQAVVLSRSRGVGCPVCAGRAIVPEENDLSTRFPAVAAQWHPTKNGKLTPEQCASSSNRKVWWTCSLGHEYQATVCARTVHGSNCPYCAGKKVLPGFNDLATLEPKIAAQWHPSLNGTLTPEMVTVGSGRKAWWECGDGHVWKAVIYSRTGKKKTGCPVCAGRIKASVQTRYASLAPELASAAEIWGNP